MLKFIIERIIQCFLIRIYPDNYEFKTIERVSSSGSFIEYYSDNEK